MDKAEKVRRAASRFSLLKRRNIISGPGGSLIREFSFPGKSKKERIRRLSVVGRRVSSSYEDCEIGCEFEISDRDDQNLGTCNKFKLPKQLLDNRNGVDHASVPRKLRSAMKKRNRESFSSPNLPDSKNANSRNKGIELQKKDSVNKSKLKMKRGGSGWCDEEAVCGAITKDEEEVVETLYALAGMFPNNDSNTELDTESLQAKQSPRMEFEESPVTEDNLSSIQPSRNPDIKISAKETEKVSSMNEPNTQEQTNLLEGKNFIGESDNSLTQLNPQMRHLLENDENRDEKTPATSGFSLDSTTTKLPMQLEASFFKTRSEITFRLVMDNDTHPEEKHKNNEPNKNDQALCLSLSSSVLLGAGNHDPLQSLNLPPWLDTALCTRRYGLTENNYNKKKSFDFLYLSTNRSFKRPAVTMEAGNQIQVPYQQNPLAQQQKLPFILPQARYWSATYPDQLSASVTQQVQINLPPYFSNKSSSESRPNPATLTKAVQQQMSLQQQHQQWFWAAQMAANCRQPVGTTTTTVRLPSWKTGRHDSPSLIPCTQPLNDPTRPFLDITGPKYPSFTPQQQQFMVMTSLTTARLKGQDRLPSIYEENGGGFHANSQLPLQLLCNERY